MSRQGFLLLSSSHSGSGKKRGFVCWDMLRQQRAVQTRENCFFLTLLTGNLRWQLNIIPITLLDNSPWGWGEYGVQVAWLQLVEGRRNY